MFNYAIDIFFAIDIIIIFNTALINESFETIDDRCVIAKEYIKSWFFIDLLSIIPFEVILVAFSDVGGISDDGHTTRVN